MIKTMVTSSLVRMMAVALALAFGLASTAMAGEGCGANRWRDHNGYCHWFGGPGGSYRGTAIECPPGMYIGPGRRACWPVR